MEDYRKIVHLIDFYATDITITPNILTEICNISDKFNKESNFRFFRYLEEFLHIQNEHIEHSKETIVNNNKCYIKLGIADASVLNLARRNKLVLTDDLDLYHFLISQGLYAINYNHLIQLDLPK